MEDDEEDEEMKLALAMSMQQASSGRRRRPRWWRVQRPGVRQLMLAQLPGVDPTILRFKLLDVDQPGWREEGRRRAGAGAGALGLYDAHWPAHRPRPRERRASVLLRASRRARVSRILLAWFAPRGRPIRENRRHRSNTSSTKAKRRLQSTRCPINSARPATSPQLF